MLKFWKKKPAETPPMPPAELTPADAAMFDSSHPLLDEVLAERRVDSSAELMHAFDDVPASSETAAEARFEATVAPTAVEEAAAAKRSWRERLSDNAFSRGLSSLFVRHARLDDDLLDELETTLITADVGVEASTELVEGLRKRMHKREFADPPALLAALRASLIALLKPIEKPLDVRGHKPFVVLTVGINGAGKTTTIGKLARRWRDEGRAVILAAGDTFRAAAVQQLQTWGERNQVAVISQARMPTRPASFSTHCRRRVRVAPTS